MLKKCTECGHELRQTTGELVETIGSRTFVASAPALKCSKCGETFFDGDVLRRFDLFVAHNLAQLGASDGDAFRFMRKALGMKAAELAKYLDLDEATISRWETGKRGPDRAALATVASLVADKIDGRTQVISILKALGDPSKPAKRTTIDLARKKMSN